MGIVEDNQIRWFYSGAAIEIDPVIHDPNGVSLMVVIQVRAGVIPALKATDLEAREKRRLANNLGCEHAISCQISDGHPLIQCPVGDKQSY
jgi:hypothetical protein